MLKFIQDITSWLKVLETELPQILGTAELILVRISLFGIFMYGLWRLIVAVFQAHG